MYEPGQVVDFKGTYYRVKIGLLVVMLLIQIIFPIKWQILQQKVELTLHLLLTLTTKFLSRLRYSISRNTRCSRFCLFASEYHKVHGFIFDTYNKTLQEIENWKLSCKEFMFWTTQNWGEGAVLTISPSARQIAFTTHLQWLMISAIIFMTTVL